MPEPAETVRRGEPGAAPAASAQSLSKLFAAVAALALLVAALWLLGRWIGTGIPAFRGWVEGLGVWGPLAFVAGYAIAVVAFVPASALTIAAGATFGVVRGTAYVFVAASLGACLAFLVARHLARDAVERRIAGDRRFAAIDRAIGEQGRRIVLLLRLSPAFPFNLLNYALGLSRVRFADYALACIGMLPGTLAYVYSGQVAADVATAAGGGGGSLTLRALRAAGLVATIAVTVLVTRIARRALSEATAPEERG